MPSPDFNQATVRKSVQTTDATVTTLSTFMVYPDTVLHLRSIVVGRRTGGASGTAGDSAGYELNASFKTSGGTAVLIGAIDKVEAEDQSAWDVTYTVSGATVILTVAGASGNNVNWSANTQVIRTK